VKITSFNGPALGSPTWSPDGRWIALDCARGRHQIYVVPADGGAPPRNISNSSSADSTPSWSHDGDWIYFDSDRSGRYEVWKMRSDGGTAIRVTHSGGGRAIPSPDGRFVYFRKSLSGTVSDEGAPLMRVPADGGEEVQMVPRIRGFTVTEKGLYYSTPQKTIEFLDTSSGKVSNLSTLDRAPTLLSASPDDAYVLFPRVGRNIRDLMLVEGFR